MRGFLLWALTLVSLGVAIFLWRQNQDLQGRLDGLTEQVKTTNAGVSGELARLKTMEGTVDAIDRAFSRALNSQDAIARAFATLRIAPEQADVKATIEARLAKLSEDLEPQAKVVRDMLLEIEPAGFKLDPAKVSTEANAAFLAKIDADPTYSRTESGLRYKAVKTVAEGKQPDRSSEVTVNYKGTFIEGTEFDSSYKAGQPATFLLDKLIPGWSEGIPLMKQGETFEFVVPYNLAYGVAGRGPIPPRQTLVFQVELLNIADPRPPLVHGVPPPGETEPQ